MTWLLTKIRAYGYIAAGLVVAILTGSLLNERRKHWKEKANHYQAKAKRIRDVAERDNELEAEFQSRRGQAADEIRRGDSSVFRDPSSLFDDKDDS